MELWGRYDGGEWELLDEADEDNDIDVLMSEYAMAFGAGWEFEKR